MTQQVNWHQLPPGKALDCEVQRSLGFLVFCEDAPASDDVCWYHDPEHGRTLVPNHSTDVNVILEMICENVPFLQCKVGVWRTIGGWRATIDGQHEYEANTPAEALSKAWLAYKHQIIISISIGPLP
jgi:hypothetical protein